MNILIAGGAGFIGRFFCERLVERGQSVTVLDLVVPTDLPAGIRVVKGDIRDPEAVRAALQGCDSVLQLAAAHHDFGISPETYFSVNRDGARVLCQVMDELKVRRVCSYSTVAVYGDAPEPRHEETPCHPVGPYGESKWAGEEVIREWVDQGASRSALILRPTVVFGPHNYANMFALIRQIDTGRFISVGSGRNIKSLCYVENLVDATLHVWDDTEHAPFEVYNYVDKPDLCSREIIDAVRRALGRRPPRVSIPLWAALAAGFPFDLFTALSGKDLAISMARIKKFAQVQSKFEADKIRATGFRPRVPLVEGISRMVEWYRIDGKIRPPVRHLPPAEIVVRDVETRQVSA